MCNLNGISESKIYVNLFQIRKLQMPSPYKIQAFGIDSKSGSAHFFGQPKMTLVHQNKVMLITVKQMPGKNKSNQNNNMAL